MSDRWMFSPLQRGSVDFIMIDPAWRFIVRNRDTGLKKSADRHYRTMTLEEIKALPVRELAAKDCLIWMWATSPMLKIAFEVFDAWGVTFKTQGMWVKRTKNAKLAFGTGYRLRSAGEPFLIGTFGNPKSTRSTRNIICHPSYLEIPDVGAVIEGPLREHSRKPDEAYVAAENMMPSAVRADIFSREVRPGWTAFGDEILKFSKEAA